jgi:hypothetical protein
VVVAVVAVDPQKAQLAELQQQVVVQVQHQEQTTTTAQPTQAVAVVEQVRACKVHQVVLE